MKSLWVAIFMSVFSLSLLSDGQVAQGQTTDPKAVAPQTDKKKNTQTKKKSLKGKKKPTRKMNSKSRNSTKALGVSPDQNQTEADRVRWREQYGAGVTIGEIAGLNVRLPFLNHHYQFFIASSDSGRNYLFSLDRIFLYPGFLEEIPSAAVYYGAGVSIIKSPTWFKARAGINETSKIGVGLKLPVGFVVPVSGVPIEFTAEAAPGILFAPTAAAFIDAQFGLRVVL